MVRCVIFSLTSFILLGCASAWVVHQSDEGGVIAYKNYTDADKATAAVTALIHCPNGYSPVSDELKSSNYTYTAYQPVTSYGTSSGTINSPYGGSYSYSGHDQRTAYIPTTQVGTSLWREFTYRCGSTSTVVSQPTDPYRSLSERIKAAGAPSSCAQECNALADRGGLKKGVTADECIRASCQ